MMSLKDLFIFNLGNNNNYSRPPMRGKVYQEVHAGDEFDYDGEEYIKLVDTVFDEDGHALNSVQRFSGELVYIPHDHIVQVRI